METIANENDFDPLARLRGLIDESRAMREAYERQRRDEPEPPPVQSLKRVANRNQVAPIGRLHRLLRQAYVSGGGTVSGGQAGAVLERAQLYREKCLFKTCSKCEGGGQIEPKAKDVAKWQERAKLFALVMTPEEFEAKFPLPMPRSCPKCSGDGTQLGGHREVTAKPKGSSVVGSPEQSDADPVWLIDTSRAGRVARRVGQLNQRHGAVLQAYYGDGATVSALAHAHGRLVLLYPLTATGADLLERSDAADPWRFLAEFMTELDDAARKLDADMQGEAYHLLCDATDTWDDAVEIEIPHWNEAHA
jgi:hypothetical protein